MSNLLTVLALSASSVVPIPAIPGPSIVLSGPQADTTIRSAPADRRSVSLTLYSQGFGMVTDLRRSRLVEGRVRLDFPGVAPELRESTVRLAAGDESGALRTLEQRFRWQPLTPDRLLRAHVGEVVRVHPRDASGMEGAPVEAELLSVEDGPVLRMDGRVTYGVDGRISFPEVPASLAARPTLSWVLDVEDPPEEIAVSYLADGLGWTADYVLTLGPDGGSPASLAGWVELRNRSGLDWPDARVHLVAGEVKQASGGGDRRGAMAMMEASRAAPDVSRQELFAYHRYSLGRAVTLPDGVTKRVSLFQADGVGLTRRYEVRGSAGGFRNPGDGPDQVPVEVVLVMENREDRGLGMPLPGGMVRVYAAGRTDADAAGAFLGEDRITHTPEGESAEVVPGLAFDLTAERVQTDYEALGRCAAESAWEIRLRNARDRSASVRVVEPVSGEWEVLEASHPHEEVDAGTLRFEVEVPGEGTETVSYRVRVSWC